MCIQWEALKHRDFWPHIFLKVIFWMAQIIWLNKNYKILHVLCDFIGILNIRL
jgi:hypothetical protein